MCLDRILKVPEMKKDPYTQLALASYYLKCMPALTKTEKDVDIADRCLRLVRADSVLLAIGVSLVCLFMLCSLFEHECAVMLHAHQTKP